MLAARGLNSSSSSKPILRKSAAARACGKEKHRPNARNGVLSKTLGVDAEENNP
jgi:hypothetical protein